MPAPPDHPSLILLAEDDAIVRQASRHFLQQRGHQVLEAANGREALAMFRTARPDLIITDLRMPEIDGLEILRTVMTEQPQLPVIIVSGQGSMTDVISALRLGAFDYLTKPLFDHLLLEHAVNQALERVRLLRQHEQHQRQLEEAVQRRTAELQQAQKLEAIGTLAGGIAHDFNNILAAILGFSELALLKAQPAAGIHDDLLQIKHACQRARDLVAQILTFSRRHHIDRQPLSIQPIIKEALKLLRATLPATVELRQQMLVPSGAILADPTEMHQLIMNLCTNAFHALEKEQGHIEVRLERTMLSEAEAAGKGLFHQGPYLQLSICDNGCGMEQEMLARIFDPFFTTKTPEQGTGLGLSVVQDIVRQCQGSILVSSTPGVGSCFSLLFPEVEKKDPVPVVLTGTLPHGQEHLLLVDDEAMLREMGCRMLAFLGYQVSSCASGQEALQLLATASPPIDMVITDQSMPRMPGSELLQAIQKEYPRLPVILYTGFSSMIDETGALALGARRFLLKPLSLHALAHCVREVLDEQQPGA